MARYKVPQDVEADDKLLGPFTFRQFVYLLITAGLIAIAVLLFQVLWPLALIPVPAILLFGALALPIRKDQPMETYLAALVSYFLKPRTRLWTPGQRESTITVTAPKIEEAKLTRDISGEEATHRLSFLADIVDSQGRSIQGTSAVREDLVAEANSVQDMFGEYQFSNIDRAIEKDENARHEELMRDMRAAIASNGVAPLSAPVQPVPAQPVAPSTNPAAIAATKSIYDSPVVVQPTIIMPTPAEEPAEEEEPEPVEIEPEEPEQPEPLPEEPAEEPVEEPIQKEPAEEPQKALPKSAKPGIMDLANNSDFSVATIAKQAKRIKGKDDGEVFISLH